MLLNKTLIFSELNVFKEIAHFCTTRQGGVSEGNFSSFNLSPFSGDSTENFYENLQILSHEIGLPAEDFIFPFQTHEDKICVIDKSFVSLSELEKSKALQGIDALITNQKGICIGVTTADCVPILIYDRKQKVIAAVHAGWRGTQARLVQKTLAQMQENFGTILQDVFVVIGPSISAEVYEVGRELIAEFEKVNFPIEKLFSERNEKLFLDLWEANHWLLTESGVPATQIQISGICTYTQHDRFFSARRLGIKSGRMYSGIVLKHEAER